MAIVVPMLWRSVAVGASVVLADGTTRLVDANEPRRGKPGVRHVALSMAYYGEWYEFNADDVVPVIVPSDAEQIGAVIVNLIKAGFHVTPVPET